MLENADTEKMKSTSLNGYRLFSIEVEYDGEAARDENAGEEDKEGERTGGERGMASLQSGVLQRGRRTEGCTGERKAVEVSRDKRAMETKRKRENGGRGRPRKDEPTQTVHCVKAEFTTEDKFVIEKEMLKKGKFIVAINESDSEKLSDEEVLKAYKCGALPHDPASPVRA